MQKRITIDDMRLTLEVLKRFEKSFNRHPETAKALHEAAAIIEGELELERNADQEAHAEVMLILERGREIPLAEWARKNGINPANARQRALRGNLPAHKVGNVWLINELTPPGTNKGEG